MLPTFGGDDGNNPLVHFEFIAQRMPNYMIIIQTKNFKPRYYDPSENSTIQLHSPSHVATFYVCHMARMICGFASIEDTWNTHDSLNAIAAAI